MSLSHSFCIPLTIFLSLSLVRLDSIAVDAELEEKSEADLKKLAEVLQRNVDESMEEYHQKMKEDPSFDGVCASRICVQSVYNDDNVRYY